MDDELMITGGFLLIWFVVSDGLFQRGGDYLGKLGMMASDEHSLGIGYIFNQPLILYHVVSLLNSVHFEKCHVDLARIESQVFSCR